MKKKNRKKIEDYLKTFEPDEEKIDLTYHEQQIRKEKIMKINELQNKGLL